MSRLKVGSLSHGGMVQLTIVAVNGMLSIKDDAMAETQTTRIMAVARRRSSGTIWKGADNSSATYHGDIDKSHTLRM